MLSGRYPSDDFADLRPRLTWDRLTNTLTAREGAKRVAVINGGTIPDRGLYGVFLARRARSRRRASASSTKRWCSRAASARRSCSAPRRWRIEEITHDRVLVSPAPGEPGKMPFWKADAAGRPLELGSPIGELVRDAAADAAGRRRSTARREHHDLDAAGRREPAALPRRSGRRRRRRPRRSDDRDRALPRRARRLAHLRALAVRRPHPRAVGDGGGRARSRGDRPRRRDDVDRRRVRGALPGDGRAARSRRC